MACEVNNKEINSQCAELLVRPTYNRMTFILFNSNTLQNHYSLLVLYDNFQFQSFSLRIFKVDCKISLLL